MRGLTASLMLLGALTAAAEPVGGLAMHPLVVEEASAEDAGLLTDWFAETVAGMRQLRVVTRERVDSALAAEVGDRCIGEASPCLGRVATKVGAARAAMVTVRLYPVVAVGQVAGPDGKLLAPPVMKQKSAPQATRLETAKAAIEEVLRELPLDDESYLLAPLVPDRPTPGPTAPSPSGRPLVSGDSQWRTRAGYGLGAVAVVAAAGGALLGVQGLAASARFDDEVRQGNRQVMALRSLQEEAATKQTAGLCLLGAALVSGVAGGYFILSPGDQGIAAELTMSPVGPVLVGTFP